LIFERIVPTLRFLIVTVETEREKERERERERERKREKVYNLYVFRISNLILLPA